MTPFASEISRLALLPPKKRKTVSDSTRFVDNFGEPLCFDCTAIKDYHTLPAPPDNWLITLPAESTFLELGPAVASRTGRVGIKISNNTEVAEKAHNELIDQARMDGHAAALDDLLRLDTSHFALIEPATWNTRKDYIQIPQAIAFAYWVDTLDTIIFSSLFNDKHGNIQSGMILPNHPLGTIVTLTFQLLYTISQAKPHQVISHQSFRGRGKHAGKAIPGDKRPPLPDWREIRLDIPAPAPPLPVAVAAPAPAGTDHPGRAGTPHRYHEVRPFSRTMKKSGKVVPVKAHSRGNKALGVSKHYYRLHADFRPDQEGGR